MKPRDFARQLMREATGIDPKPDQCARCGKQVDPAVEFKDAASCREWTITQTCSTCQDAIFAEPCDEGATREG